VPIETYTPSSVVFDGCPVESPVLLTLYDPDGTAASGSLTASDPLAEGRTGRLVTKAERDGKVWSVICPQITVTNRSAVGCEFAISSEVQRTVIEDHQEPPTPRQKGFEEQFDIR